MSELTTEQIEKVFSMYWGAELKWSTHTYPVPYMLGDASFRKTLLPECKLLLRPLSAITDEDAIEVAKMYGYDANDSDLLPEFRERSFLIELGRSCSTQEHIRLLQYFINRGYAVPLWIDVDHPDNGKTAIELGLAIDSTIPHD